MKFEYGSAYFWLLYIYGQALVASFRETEYCVNLTVTTCFYKIRKEFELCIQQA